MQSTPAAPQTLFPGIGHAVLLVLGAVGLQITCSLFIWGAATAIDAPSGAAILFDPWVLAAVNCVSFGAMIALGLRKTRESIASFFRIAPFRLRLLPAIGLTSLGFAVVLAEADNVILELLELLPGLGGNDLDWLDPRAAPVGTFVVLVVVAPLTEEYLFRRLILRGLLTRQRAMTAIFTSALLFGLVHANVRQGFLGLVIGGVFGWWYLRTKSVGPGMIGHALFNSVAFLGGVLPEFFGELNHPGLPIQHQPLGITGLGFAVAAAGLWLFHRFAVLPPEDPPSTTPPGPVPPLLPPVAPAMPSSQPADSPAS